jgi:hypothetical protein
LSMGQQEGTDDLGKRLMRRKVEVERKKKGKSLSPSSILVPLPLSQTEGESGGVKGTPMRRTVSHDIVTFPGTGTGTETGASGGGDPVGSSTMARRGSTEREGRGSSRSRREVGLPRNLRDYEMEIAV